MISHEKKFVFIHIPRTGGGSLKKVLEPHCINPMVLNEDERTKPRVEFNKWAYHKSLAWHTWYLKEKCGLTAPQILDYTFFTIVRNPWERALSDILWATDRPFERQAFKEKLFQGTTGFAEMPGGFHDLEGRMSQHEPSSSPQWWTLSMRPYVLFQETIEFDYLTRQLLFSGIIPPYVQYIRYENYNTEVPAMLRKLGIEFEAQDYTQDFHSTIHKHYSHYYESDEIRHVAAICAADIKKWGYTFEKEINDIA